MKNDGIHMPELSEPTLDELERLAEAIGERADGFELDMPDGSVARGYRAPGIHGTLPEGWRVYDIMECDSERWTPYPGYEDEREDGENGRYETSLVIDDNPGPHFVDQGDVGPALEHVRGFFPDGAETLARYVREIDMGIDPDTGEELERAAAEEPAFRTSFRIRAMAGADPEDEPALDRVIQAADADYRHDVISGGDAARADWRNAAAYEWRRLMLEPHAPTDPVSDVSALAVIAVSMRYAPDATRAMIATDVLGPDMPTMGGLRDIIGTPEQDVPVDTLITDLVGQWPDATPDRDTLADRDHAAWRILSPIQQNAPAPVEGHIYGLLGMLDHVEYLGRTGETGRIHAERALRFDPSDRFAAAVLDTAPTADGSTGLAELADIAQDRGAIR